MYRDFDAAATVADCARLEKSKNRRGRNKPVGTGVFYVLPKDIKADLIRLGFGDRLEQACWCIHHIASKSRERSDDEWVELSAKTCRHFVTSRWSDVLRDLCDARVLKPDNRYIVGEKSIAYQINDRFKRELEFVECENQRIAERLFEYRTRRDERARSEVEEHELRWLMEVKINKQQAMKGIDDAFDRYAAKKLTKKKLKQLPYYKSNQQLPVELVSRGEIDFRQCPFGRFHSPVTRMASIARAELFFDGHEKLIALDIKNSQIFFLTMTLLKEDRQNQGQGEKGMGRDNNTPMMSHLMSSDATRDLKLFLQLTIDGEIYDYLMQHFPARPDETYIERRGRFKKEFFRDFLYGDFTKDYCINSPLAKLVRRLFPTIFRYVFEAKRGDFKKLAHRMQREESSFIHGQFVNRLRLERPEVPVITIHDAVMVPANFAQDVLAMMEDEFMRVFGVKPAVSVK